MAAQPGIIRAMDAASRVSLVTYAGLTLLFFLGHHVTNDAALVVVAGAVVQSLRVRATYSPDGRFVLAGSESGKP